MWTTISNYKLWTLVFGGLHLTNNPECKQSPTGKHEYKQSSSMPAVIGITGCFYCVHCGDHKDTYSNYIEPLYSSMDLAKRGAS